MADPSPICEVKNGALPYASTANGVNIDTANTVIIRLADQSGVDSWLIECATTDDTSTASSVTASLSIDAINKTATFTAPATGKAYRFRSTVNGGIDRNGIARPSYTTTFCLYTLLNARRVVAADETTEGDSTFGWIKWLNDMIRNPPGAVYPQGSDNQFQYKNGTGLAGATGLVYVPSTMQVDVKVRTASMGSANVATLVVVALGFATQFSATGAAFFQPNLNGVQGTGVATLMTARTQNLLVASQATMAAAAIVQATMGTGCDIVAAKLLSPLIAGTMVYTGTDQVNVGLADHQPVSVVRSVVATGTTAKNVFAFKPLDEAITSVVVEGNAVPSGGAAAGSYVRRASIWMNGGVGTCGSLDSSYSSEFTASAVGFTGLSVTTGIGIGVSGATGFVNVLCGATGLVKWGLTITMQTTSWA
jgi:hypothetical protein